MKIEFEIPAAYVGETVSPILELDVESTGGMIESSQYNIF